MGVSIANIDIGGALIGLGQLAKDLSAAITGKEPINAEKAAENCAQNAGTSGWPGKCKDAGHAC